MKNKKIIIPVALVAVILIASVAIFMITRQKPVTEPTASDDSGSVAPIEVGDYIATDYPSELPQEAVKGVLGSLNAYVDNILSPDFTAAAFLDYSHQNQILRINVTETACEATLVTKENAGDLTGDKNPLRSTKQLVTYAAKSGHTINDLSIKDEIARVGAKDFSAYLEGLSPVAGTNSAPEHYELPEHARKEIIKYCSDMLVDNRDTELFMLSDNVIAFVMCEWYSEESLLGSFSFLERGEDDVYRLRTVIDFNC